MRAQRWRLNCLCKFFYRFSEYFCFVHRWSVVSLPFSSVEPESRIVRLQNRKSQVYTASRCTLPALAPSLCRRNELNLIENHNVCWETSIENLHRWFKGTKIYRMYLGNKASLRSLLCGGSSSPSARASVYCATSSNTPGQFSLSKQFSLSNFKYQTVPGSINMLNVWQHALIGQLESEYTRIKFLSSTYVTSKWLKNSTNPESERPNSIMYCATRDL